jgi:hypothetical protein
VASIPKGDKKKMERLEKRILAKKHAADIRWLLVKVQCRSTPPKLTRCLVFFACLG